MATRALLVIDVQKVYTAKGSDLYCQNAAATVRRINALVDDATKRRDLVVMVRHIHRRDGSDLGRMFDYEGEAADDFNFKQGSDEVEFDPELLTVKDAVSVVKTRYSAFVGTTLDRILRKRKVDSVTICGFMTNFCCEGTARQAHDLDYFVDFVADATGTPGTERQTQAELRQRVADNLSSGYARIWNTKRWCKRPS